MGNNDLPAEESDWLDDQADLMAGEVKPNHPMESREMRREHNRLSDWYYQELERQSVNRFHMAIDSDYYDNEQWSSEDAQEVKDRGQMAIVYNECAPMCDWMIGTERRTRVDWKVLPRTPDDVQAADVKTKVLKYLSDVNNAQFQRSQAFNDAVKAGVGWVEDGVRLDPTQELVFSRREDWRNVIWDSSSYELDLSDARYLFRRRWVDLDIALACFPDRADVLKAAAMANLSVTEEDEDVWFMGQLLNDGELSASGQRYDRHSYSGMSGNLGERRSRVKLIECQYRKPIPTKIVADGPFQRSIYNPADRAMVMASQAGEIELEDHVMMVMHRAIMTDDHMIRQGVAPYRHNRFSLTPIWCYRRGRDRMPYGAIRRIRDIQDSINKRMSKAVWLVSTNQVITEVGAVEDFDELAQEAARPDGVLVVKAGKRLDIRRDAEQVQYLMQLAEIDTNKLQRSAGVADENLGRQTNAVSGKAIEARQLQGSVVTTEPFDNLRMAIQWQGEKRLSLAEQFISEPRALRLTEGQKGKIEWLKINQPKVGPDGTVTFEDDITASAADFIVSEQDFHGSLRQAMFVTMMEMIKGLPDPAMQLRMMILAYDFSDMPNKDEIVAEIRKMANVPDPNKEPSPEEQQALQQAKDREQRMLEIQMATAEATLGEAQAKVQLINAQAEELRSKALDGDGNENAAAIDQVMQESRQLQQQAADEIEALTQKLAQATLESRNKTMEIGKKADTEIQSARIQADAMVRVAEIEKESNAALDAFAKQLADLATGVDDLTKQVAESVKADKAEK